MANPRESAAGIDAVYDWSETSPTTGVVECVAASAGCDPVDLDVLCDSVDPDALDALLAADTGATITFEYAAHRVTIAGDGALSARPKE